MHRKVREARRFELAVRAVTQAGDAPPRRHATRELTGASLTIVRLIRPMVMFAATASRKNTKQHCEPAIQNSQRDRNTASRKRRPDRQLQQLPLSALQCPHGAIGA